MSGFDDESVPPLFERKFREKFPGELESLEAAYEARQAAKEARRAVYAPSMSFSFGFSQPR